MVEGKCEQVDRNYQGIVIKKMTYGGKDLKRLATGIFYFKNLYLLCYLEYKEGEAGVNGFRELRHSSQLR